MSNIDKFNTIVLHVLVKLYDCFPVPATLDAAKIAVDALNAINPESEKPQVFEQEDILGSHTLNWLTQEGFISVKQKTLTGSYFEVQLTLKGLTLLGYTLPTNESVTLIDQAKDVLSGAVKDTAKDVLTKLFTTAASLTMTAMG